MKSQEFVITDINSNPLIKTFHSTVSAGKREYTEHHHTECEFSMCLTGSGVYRVGSFEYEFKSGDIFIFASDEVHCITNIYPSDAIDLFNIHFEPRLIWASGDMSTLPLLMLFNERSDSFSNMIDRENPNTETIKTLLFDIENQFKTDKLGSDLKIKLDVYNILLLLLNEYGYVNQRGESSPNTLIFRQLSDAMNYINENLSRSLTLDEVAHVATMSKSYFSTVFKKYNGISPWNYITIKRVEKAISLLKNSGLSKTEIAGQCGFASPANFYKAFANITGKTPSYYSTHHSG